MILILYLQIKPNDAFGRQMLMNLEVREICLAMALVTSAFVTFCLLPAAAELMLSFVSRVSSLVAVL